MELFDETTLKCSRLITQHYSTSFTLGIKTLEAKYRLPIYAVYGFVRYAAVSGTTPTRPSAAASASTPCSTPSS